MLAGVKLDPSQKSGQGSKTDKQLAELALVYKPVIAERAKANQLRTAENRVRPTLDRQEVDTSTELNIRPKWDKGLDTSRELIATASCSILSAPKKS